MQPDQSIPFQQELLILSYKCPLEWEDMDGDDVSRHCSKCSFHVQNLSEMLQPEVDQIFKKIDEGERVCIRSEGTGFRRTPRSTKERHPFRFGLVASSIAIAWFIGFLKAPILAKSEKSRSERGKNSDGKSAAATVYKFGEQRSLGVDGNSTQSGVGGTGQLAYLGVVDRYVSPLHLKTNALWTRIMSLKVSPEFLVRASGNVDKLRKSIVTRAENDKTIVTEDVLHLSKLYRREGFDQAADDCLGIAVALLDAIRSKSKATDHASDSEDRGVQFVAYSQMKNFELSQFHSCLNNYKARLEQNQPQIAGEFLQAAMTIVWKNPLLLNEFKKEKLSSKVKALHPSISKELSTKLDMLDSKLSERLLELDTYI